MKKLLLAIAVLFSVSASAQLSLTGPHKKKPKETVWFADARLNCSCDTLFIKIPTKIKIINIGGVCYDIVPHETTIEIVKPNQILLGRGYVPYNGSVTLPNGSISN